MHKPLRPDLISLSSRRKRVKTLFKNHDNRKKELTATPRKSPFSCSAATSSSRTSNLFFPLNSGPPASLISPSSVRMFRNSRLWRFPTAKSLGSCAGVILTAPVPKLMSTSSASQMIGRRRPLKGWTTNLPCRCLYLQGFGRNLRCSGFGELIPGTGSEGSLGGCTTQWITNGRTSEHVDGVRIARPSSTLQGAEQAAIVGELKHQLSVMMESSGFTVQSCAACCTGGLST